MKGACCVLNRFQIFSFLALGLLMVPVAGWSQAPRMDAQSSANKSGDADIRLDAIKSTLKLALQRLERARSNKDIIQLNCVNDKLTSIKGFLRISEQARVSLAEAMGQRDFDLVEHEFQKISVAAARVENLRLQVEGCVGELSQYTGDPDTRIEVSAQIRTDEPVLEEYRPVFEALNVERPPAVSGSQ